MWHTPTPEPVPAVMTMVVCDRLSKALAQPDAKPLADEALSQYLAKRRWFGLKDQTIKTARIATIADLGASEREMSLCEIEVKTTSSVSRWLLPLGILWEHEPSTALSNSLALAQVRRGGRLGLLTDAFVFPEFAHQVLGAISDEKDLPCNEGVIHFRATEAGRTQKALSVSADVRWLTAEQSNSSLIVGDATMLKLYRRLSSGPHPEVEMNRYLTTQGFAHAPSLLADVVRIAPDSTSVTLAILLQFVPNEGDAWSWMLEHLTRALDAHASGGPLEASRADLTDCDIIAAAIGRRLGQMHAVLARDTTERAFAPESASAADAIHWASEAEKQARKAFEALSQFQTWERETDRAKGQKLLKNRDRIIKAVRHLAEIAVGTLKTRIHGDFHLGQVLVDNGDVHIIDFEGEAAASIERRRAKTSPLRDIAGLLRSIDYAAATMARKTVTAPLRVDQRDRLLAEFRSRSSSLFLDAYCEAKGARHNNSERALLNLFLIEKAAYEISYEAANRPSWISIPVDGFERLCRRLLEKEPGNS